MHYISIHWFDIRIKPILSNIFDIIVTHALFPIKEYNKDNLKDKSYIFTPNHTNNLDGYIIWCLLSKYYDIDTFMYKEFWDNYPNISKLLNIVNVYPITRDKLVMHEIKDELEKLKNENHSLVIFPQGRHVDPEIMLNFPEYHINTIPYGAFYFSAVSEKSFVPIYIESQKLFGKSVVVYGNPINPLEYDIKNKNGKIQVRNLKVLSKKWLEEVNKCYLFAEEVEGRKMRPYTLRENYFDENGNHNLKDTNVIVNYLNEVKELIELSKKNNCDNIDELCNILKISDDIKEEIKSVKLIYDNYLDRRKKK